MSACPSPWQRFWRARHGARASCRAWRCVAGGADAPTRAANRARSSRRASPARPRPEPSRALPPHYLQASLSSGSRVGPILAYHILHSEAALANALECWLFHAEAAEALAAGGDALLDLLDYCMRGANRLIMAAHARSSGGSGGAAANADPAGAAFAALGGEAAAKLAGYCADATFNIGCSAVTMLRYLAEHAPRLPLALQARLLDFHDVPLTMVPLIENPPWVRRVRRGGGGGGGGGNDNAPLIWQKFVGRAWVDVAPAELLRLTPLEGQPWLALYSLLLEPDARRRYALTAPRARALQRVRRYLSDALVEQLPPLAALRRCLDEAALGAAAAAAPATRGAALLLEPLVGGVDAVEREARARAAALRAAAGEAMPDDADDDGWRAVQRVAQRHLFGEETRAAVAAACAQPPQRSEQQLLLLPRRGGGDDDDAPEARRRAAPLSPRVSLYALAAIYDDGGDYDDGGADDGGGGTRDGCDLFTRRDGEGGGTAALAAAAGGGVDDAAPPPQPQPPPPVAGCKRCGARNALKRCSRCKLVSYCGQICQLADWADGHKATCVLPLQSKNV